MIEFIGVVLKNGDVHDTLYAKSLAELVCRFGEEYYYIEKVQVINGMYTIINVANRYQLSIHQVENRIHLTADQDTLNKALQFEKSSIIW